MNISELVNKLEHIKATKGDIEVTIQFRDEGGEYLGEGDPVIEVRESTHYTKQAATWVDGMIEYRDEECSGIRVVL